MATKREEELVVLLAHAEAERDKALDELAYAKLTSSSRRPYRGAFEEAFGGPDGNDVWAQLGDRRDLGAASASDADVPRSAAEEVAEIIADWFGRSAMVSDYELAATILVHLGKS